MLLLVIAQEPDEEYDAWRQAQRQARYVSPTEPRRMRRPESNCFCVSGPCFDMSHQIRGTMAGGGRVAPDLTHIGSRQYIAANSYPNNDAYLEAWVTHAQSLKPGGADARTWPRSTASNFDRSWCGISSASLQ